MAQGSVLNLSELAAFRADDAVIEMIPQFALQQPLILHTSTKPIGPWQSGIPTKVPLWLACHLQTKRLCTVPTPAWLSISNLAEILAFERKETSLWRDESRLPFDYYQIAQRMTLDPAVQLLIRDLLQVRMDKLRQQFQDLLQHQPPPAPADDENIPQTLVVEITGMGSVEIALLQKTVQQALKDQDKLRYAAQKSKKSGTALGQAGPDETPTPADRPSSQRRVALRKFR